MLTSLSQHRPQTCLWAAMALVIGGAIGYESCSTRSTNTPAQAFATMQTDAVDVFARQILPRLTGLQVDQGLASTAQELLRGWDGATAIDTPQSLIFNAWMAAFHDAALKHAGLTLTGLGAPLADFVSFVLSPDGISWCNGDCNVLLQEALATAVTSLRLRFGDDPTSWSWGRAHVATFAHPFLRDIPLLARLGTISIPFPGDDNTVGRGGLDDAFRAVHGPSYRGVYDLADLDRSLFIVGPRPIRQYLEPSRERLCHTVAQWCYYHNRPGGVLPTRSDPTIPMTDGVNYIDDSFLVGGVVTRRCLAWVADIVLIALIMLRTLVDAFFVWHPDVWYGIWGDGASALRALLLSSCLSTLPIECYARASTFRAHRTPK